MHKPPKKIILPIIAIILIVIAILFMTFYPSKSESLPGYIEANLTYISPQVSGKLKSLNVERGEQIKAGQQLFTLDGEYYTYALESAQKNIQANMASYQNLLTGARAPEIAEIEANIAQAQAKVDYLEENYARSEALLETNLISKQEHQLNYSQLLQAQSELTQLQASLTKAKLPARNQQIMNAEALSQASIDEAKQAKWYVEQTEVSSPIEAIVFDTYYWPSEIVSANQPVVSLLVPGQVKMIFFVTETELSQVSLNKKVAFSIDGNDKKMSATIRYIADKAEYTPPVIYSDASRKDLVYKVEAKINNGSDWHPGQPVSVYLGGN